MPTVAGAWLNGRAPDSGSGGSRFESWRASQLPRECGASRETRLLSHAGCRSRADDRVEPHPPLDTPERANFIREIVAADVAAGRDRGPSPAFRPSRTATSTSATPSRSASTSASPRSSAATATSASTTRTRSRRSRSTSTPSRRTSAGSGFDWGDNLFHASDYFEQLYEWAVHLVQRRQGLRRRPVRRRDPRDRGTLTAPGRTRRSATGRSPRTSTCSRACARASSRTARGCCARRSTWRRRTSTCATRCCTGSSTPRIPRTGDAWCIYPTYDFAHGQSDAIEGVTHSICTLEFEVHRPLYDWLIENLPVPSRPPPVRVRAAQPHLHRAVQARAPAARQRGPRPRLGRPADADDLGPAPARLPGRGHPRLRGR